MKKIETAIEKATKDYPKSLYEYYPGYKENGIPERNLTFQFVRAYLAGNKGAHAFFEVPFENGNKKVAHYDAIIIDNSTLIIIEAKRLHSKGKAKAIEEDVAKIVKKKFIKEIKDNFNINPPKKIYGLILADAWKSKIDKGLGNWWKGSGDMKKFKEWKVCENMNSWECNLSDPIVCWDEEKDKNTFYILYGYASLA